MYYIEKKDHESLVKLIKRHTVPGTSIFSDSHVSYVNMAASSSKLTKYGFFHFWICHASRYVHEKYGFIHTSGVEMTWCNLKRQTTGLKVANTGKLIN